MDFSEKITQFSKRVETIKDNLLTEEATKTSIILPFFQILGYDVFNPCEFVPEYTADIGTKKGEKVDYAIISDSEPIILIEAKSCSLELNTKHMGQLIRYFTVTKAKFAILTNGIIYPMCRKTPCFSYGDIKHVPLKIRKHRKNKRINWDNAKRYQI